MIVVLDNIRSKHNVGSIFRTADGAGFKKIYMCGITPGPLDKFGKENTGLTKVSLGAEKVIEWEMNCDIVEVVEKYKEDGFVIVVLEQVENSVSYEEIELSNKNFVLVLGAETVGVSDEVLGLADHIIEIPMRGDKKSLNVSVAFGVVAYFLLK